MASLDAIAQRLQHPPLDNAAFQWSIEPQVDNGCLPTPFGQIPPQRESVGSAGETPRYISLATRVRKLVGGTRKPTVGANEREADGTQETVWKRRQPLSNNNPKGLKTRKEIRRIIVVSFFFFVPPGMTQISRHLSNTFSLYENAFTL